MLLSTMYLHNEEYCSAFHFYFIFLLPSSASIKTNLAELVLFLIQQLQQSKSIFKDYFLIYIKMALANCLNLDLTYYSLLGQKIGSKR